MKRKIGLLMLIGLLVLSAAPIWADGDMYVVAGGGGVGTKITSLPYTINDSGFYYLGKNLTTTGDGIYVNASDVTIDLMGFKLTGPGRNSGKRGIFFGANMRNVEIRNGTLHSWGTAIGDGSDSSYHHDLRIINVRILFPFYGIKLKGFNLLIKGCTINDVIQGISIADGSGTISNNIVNYATATGDKGACINLESGLWTVINNTLSNGPHVLIFIANGNIIGNTIQCLAGQIGINVPTDTGYKILISQNGVMGDGTPVVGILSTIFCVGNVGLTNTNSFLAP